jgi:predicted sugar kinase
VLERVAASAVGVAVVERGGFLRAAASLVRGRSSV